MVRDFTYIDDIVSGIKLTLESIPAENPSWNSANPVSSQSSAPYRIYNIGNSSPVPLLRYIEVLEDCLGKKANKNLLPMQAGDVPNTSADMTSLQQVTGYQATTDIANGLAQWSSWYREIGYRYQAF